MEKTGADLANIGSPLKQCCDIAVHGVTAT